MSPRDGGLQKQDQVKYQYTCSQALPGLCATLDAAIISSCKLAAEELRTHLVKFETGTLFRLRVVSEGAEVESFSSPPIFARLVLG